jgi:hypothetical protein
MLKAIHIEKFAIKYTLNALFLKVYLNELKKEGACSGSFENSTLSLKLNFMKIVTVIPQIIETAIAAYV